MKRLALLLVALSACGPELTEGARLPAGVEIRGLLPEQIGAVQITVLSNANARFCGDLVKTCLNQKIEVGKDTVPVRGADGKDRNAIRESGFTPESLSGEGVTFEISVPAGTNYMVVAEILSADSKLLASGCEVRDEVVEGTGNSPLVIRAHPLDPVPECDPHID
ncbi:MAG: hypothetical protein ACOX6T_15005 [Myxococcales bacterium]|jgi:hypothetical protein